MGRASGTPNARQERRATRGRVLVACRELLEERSWAELPLEDVMSRAGLTRTAFYRHFEDREHLLLALLDELGISLSAAGATWATAVDDPLAGVHDGLAELAQTFATHGRVLRALADAAGYDRDIDARYQGLGVALTELVAGRLRDEVAAGRAQLADPGETARALVWLNERYLMQTFGRRPFATDVPTAAATLAEIWVRTVYGPAGAPGTDRPSG
jgi:AcrR family transcriptional regulator